MNLLRHFFCANSPRIGAKASGEKMVVVPGRAAGDALAYDRKSVFLKPRKWNNHSGMPDTHASWTARGLSIPEGTHGRKIFHGQETEGPEVFALRTAKRSISGSDAETVRNYTMTMIL